MQYLLSQVGALAYYVCEEFAQADLDRAGRLIHCVASEFGCWDYY